jgi:hypothetical protein
MNKNYYEILEIDGNATVAEIKAAYRKMALRYHPDKNRGNANAEKKFRQVRIAYETLIHAEKRKQYDVLLSDKNAPKFSTHAFISRKAFHAIKIFVSSRIVETDEVFEVIIKTNIPGSNFKLTGLQAFEIISEPELYRKQNPVDGEPLMQLKYKLRAKHTGYLSIGPASVVVRNIRYESDIVFIKAKEPGIIPVSNSRYEKYIIRAAIGVMIIIAGLTIYNAQRFGFRSFTSNYPLHTINYLELKTGYSPYALFYAETEKLDVASKNRLRIINKPESDMVAFLIDKATGTIVRNHFIKAGDTYEIKFIPDGDYILKVMFGNGWNHEKKIAGEKIRGGFEENISYMIFDNEAQTLQMRQTYESDSIVKYSIYEVSLNAIKNGNATSTLLHEKTFFR